jgi:hypothetical protein
VVSDISGVSLAFNPPVRHTRLEYLGLRVNYLDARKLAIELCFAIGWVVVGRLEAINMNPGCLKDIASDTAFANRLVAPGPEAVPFPLVVEN